MKWTRNYGRALRGSASGNYGNKHLDRQWLLPEQGPFGEIQSSGFASADNFYI